MRGNLTYREDTGSVNSPPVVNIPPLIRIQQGCNHTIKVSGILSYQVAALIIAISLNAPSVKISCMYTRDFKVIP